MEGYDQLDLIHKVKGFISPIKSGISNTEQELYNYLFTAGNELNYTASIADATTVIFSELPTTTTSILVYIDVYKSSTQTWLEWKRASGDATSYKIPEVGNQDAFTRVGGMYKIPTYQNSIYIVDESDTCANFIIFGYSEKES